MVVALWFSIVGGLFLLMAISGTYLRRLPISTSMLYVGVGVALGPRALILLRLEPIQQSALLVGVTEVAVAPRDTGQ